MFSSVLRLLFFYCIALYIDLSPLHFPFVDRVVHYTFPDFMCVIFCCAFGILSPIFNFAKGGHMSR
jgi:hypothetical protein